MSVLFKILITNDFKLKCSIIDEQNKETIVKLEENKEEYLPSILFNTNTIDICKEDTNSFHFMKNWIENPEDYSTIFIIFQNKEFKLVPEVMFALIINEFKKKIEKEYIIEETNVIAPTNHYLLFERIRISLESIGMKNISFNSISFDYSQQGEYLNELIERKERIDKIKKSILKAQEINPSAKDKLESIDLNQLNISTKEEFDLTLSKI